jgi:DNA mismatch repair ATPase MutS
MDNWTGVARRLTAGHVSLGKVAGGGKGKRTRFTHQYYPALLDSAAGGIVRNHVSLKKNMVITGPNASGKNTFLKTTAINVVLTQQLGCGYYGKGSRLPRLYTHIHSYLNIPDTSERDSLFQAEARRCKDILDLVEQESDGVHFSIFDELYSGTNPKEAAKSAYSLLRYLSKIEGVRFMLTTHYVSVCKRFDKEALKAISTDKESTEGNVPTDKKSTEGNVPTDKESTEGNVPTDKESSKDTSIEVSNVTNYHMESTVDESGKFHYTYRFQPGISTQEGGLEILKTMNYPEEILDEIRNTSSM